MEKKFKVLIVEDEEAITAFVSSELKFEGYQVEVAYDGKSGLDKFYETKPDMILLDWMLPEYDGLRVARIIRQQSDVPIIMMTSRSASSDVVTALDIGIDDYITKPFDIEEVLARIRVIERRSKKMQQGNLVYQYDLIKLDVAKHQVMLEDELIELTPKEFGILYELIKEPEVVKTRDELLNSIWGYEYDGQTNVVDVYIRTLRNKLGQAAKLIQTIRGVGYVLRAE